MRTVDGALDAAGAAEGQLVVGEAQAELDGVDEGAAEVEVEVVLKLRVVGLGESNKLVAETYIRGFNVEEGATRWDGFVPPRMPQTARGLDLSQGTGDVRAQSVSRGPTPGHSRVMLPARASLVVLLSLSSLTCGPGKGDSGDGETDPGEATGSTSVGHSSAPTTSGAPGEPPMTSPTGATDDPVVSTGVNGDTEFSTGGSPPPPPEACGSWIEDCPSGMKCMPVEAFGSGTWDALRCRPVDPAGAAPGEPCQISGELFGGVDDCQFHAMCLAVDDELHGRCFGMCTGAPDLPVCPGGLVCAQQNQGLLNLCLVPCDPLNPEQCRSDEVCLPDEQNFVCAPRQLDVKGADGDPCSAVNGCAAGNVCVSSSAAPDHCDTDEAGCCVPFCGLDDLDFVCPGATQCLPWFPEGEAPEGFEAVGLCTQQV